MVEHVPKLGYQCLQSLAGAPNPLDPGVPLPPLVGCGAQHIAFLLDGSLWTKSKPKKDTRTFSREWIFTKTVLVNHMSTEFTVEINPDGSTTVTTLEGSVLVTDLTSRNSVVIDANNRITVPETPAGLFEIELQKKITKIDSIDGWWKQESAKKEIDEVSGKHVVHILIIGILFWIVVIYLIIKYRKKKKK